MLTQCSMSRGSRQDEICGKADDDMLENTKPNLISYSLSTSSSNHTTVSATTNSERDDAGIDRITECAEIGMEKLTSVEYLKELNESNMSVFDVDRLLSLCAQTISGSSDECSVFSFEGGNESFKLLSDKSPNKCSKLEVANMRMYVDNTSALPYDNIRNSVSMSDLHYVDIPKNDHIFASHPQPNSQKELIRPTLSRSLSSISLKNRNRSYEHVQSKVKQYIKQLKNKKAEISGSVRKLEVNNVPLQNEDMVIIELQHEINRLQNCLEERDSLLQEVQANHHSLLLQYGEAKNKLDQLRFTTDRPVQEIKFVEREFYSKADKEVSMCLFDHDKYDPFIVEPEFVHELENQSDSQSNTTSSVIEGKKGQSGNLHETYQGIEVSDLPHLNFEARNSNELLLTNNIRTSENTLMKVSTWFMSLPRLPLPLPSCYGSLGSSASISTQQQYTCEPESELLKITPCLNLSNEYAFPVNIEQSQLVDCAQKSWTKNCNAKDGWPRDMNTTKGSETYFLPMDRCNCWTSQNREYDILEVGSSVKTEIEFSETLCVPPLNLEFSKDSTILHQNSNLSEDCHLCKDSLSSSSTLSSKFFQKCSFKPTKFSDKPKMYYDTPTSYKSILINCERARKEVSDRSSVSASLSWDTHTNRKSGLNLRSTDIQNVREINLKKNQQHSCCLKKIIASQRCWIDHTHSSCCYKRASNHQKLRCEECVSRDPATHLHAEILPNVEQFLNNVSVCAEELKQRSETIQSFLTRLVETVSNSNL